MTSKFVTLVNKEVLIVVTIVSHRDFATSENEQDDTNPTPLLEFVLVFANASSYCYAILRFETPTIMLGKRLYSQTIGRYQTPSWCLFEQPIKKRKVETAGPPKPRSHDHKAVIVAHRQAIDKLQRPKRVTNQFRGFKTVSDSTYGLLKTVVDSDQALTYVTNEVERRHSACGDLVEIKSAEIGKFMRYESDGMHGALEKKESAQRRFDQDLEDLRNSVNELADMLPELEKERKQAFSKLYSHLKSARMTGQGRKIRRVIFCLMSSSSVFRRYSMLGRPTQCKRRPLSSSVSAWSNYIDD